MRVDALYSDSQQSETILLEKVDFRIFYLAICDRYRRCQVPSNQTCKRGKTILNHLTCCIGNEVGDETVTASEFIAGYTNVIQTMRNAGIHTPLIIDAAEWGKNLALLDATASTLLNADPDKNLLFSVHLYWSISDGADANYIRTHLQNSVNIGYPLIVGEFSKFGGYPGDPTASVCSAKGKIDYQSILEVCHKNEIGWYAWEWGPGNAFNDPLCAVMDMTPDRLFQHIKPGWAKEVAISSPYSIKNTSVTPPSM